MTESVANLPAGPPAPRPNPALRPLDALVGRWATEIPQYPGVRGRAIFEWLDGEPCSSAVRISSPPRCPRRRR